MMAENSKNIEMILEYDGKTRGLKIVIDGIEVPDVRRIELVLPIYTDPIMQIHRMTSPPGTIETNEMIIITKISNLSAKIEVPIEIDTPDDGVNQSGI
jgi:hypothetical protein